MRLFILCASMIFALASCATTRDHVTIQYAPMETTEKVAEAENIAVNVQINDSRPNKERIGRKKNGYGMDCASIMSENDVSLVVKDAISIELQKKGFQLSDNEKSAILNVDLHKFSNDFKPGFWTGKAIAEMVLDVKVLSGENKLTFSKTLSSTGVNKGVMLYSGENAKIALEEALRNTVKELMQDPHFINTLLETGKLKQAETGLVH